MDFRSAAPLPLRSCVGVTLLPPRRCLCEAPGLERHHHLTGPDPRELVLFDVCVFFKQPFFSFFFFFFFLGGVKENQKRCHHVRGALKKTPPCFDLPLRQICGYMARWLPKGRPQGPNYG